MLIEGMGRLAESPQSPKEKGVSTMMSQTMSPLGLHQTSNRTIGLGSSAEELPHVMARTFMSSSGDSIVNNEVD